MTWKRLGDAELVAFAQDFVAGTIFTSFHVPPEDQERLLPRIFLPLAFEETLSDKDKELVGALWAPLKEAINDVEGYPMFATVNVLHQDDWKLVAKLIHRLQGAT